MTPQLEVVVNWWTDQLANGTRQDNGDAMTAALMSMLKFAPPSPTQLQTFRAALAEAMEKRLAGPSFNHSIYNDYHPDPALREAAQKAGIVDDCPPFPIKTCMWIKPGRVSVRHGYGAKEQVLWEENSTSTRGEDHG